jgi:hypothetical protein
MRTIAWKKKGSKGELYDCTVKVLDNQKLIFWIDCTCWNFSNRRIQQVGDFSDKKYYAEPCKHLKPIVDALIKQGYTLKKPKEMEGPDHMTAEVRRAVVERSNGICEWIDCDAQATQFHRNVRGSNGGKYTLENVRHLCKFHHQLIHGNEFPGSKSTSSSSKDIIKLKQEMEDSNKCKEEKNEK